MPSKIFRNHMKAELPYSPNEPPDWLWEGLCTRKIRSSTSTGSGSCHAYSPPRGQGRQRAILTGTAWRTLYWVRPKHGAVQVFLQTREGTFAPLPQPALTADKSYEDAGMALFDWDNDGDNDLLVASGGNLDRPGSKMLQPRLYANDGRGNVRTRYRQFAPDQRERFLCKRLRFQQGREHGCVHRG